MIVSTGSQSPCSANSTASATSLAASASIASMSACVISPSLRARSSKALDGIVLLVLLDFFLRAVELGVVHGVRAKPIGLELEEARLVRLADELGLVVHRAVDCNDVHAIDRIRRNAVRRRIVRDVAV